MMIFIIYIPGSSSNQQSLLPSQPCTTQRNEPLSLPCSPSSCSTSPRLQCTWPESFRVVGSRTPVVASPLDFLHSMPFSFNFSNITFFSLIVWYFSISSTFIVFLQHFKLVSMSVQNLCIKFSFFLIL
jgi:hypothetical protein